MPAENNPASNFLSWFSGSCLEFLSWFPSGVDCNLKCKPNNPFLIELLLVRGSSQQQKDTRAAVARGLTAITRRKKNETTYGMTASRGQNRPHSSGRAPPASSSEHSTDKRKECSSHLQCFLPESWAMLPDKPISFPRSKQAKYFHCA